MSHHGSDDEAMRAMRAAMGNLLGEFPDGKMNANDEGAIAMSVSVEKGRVVMRFPKPVAWIGMTGDEALGLAQMLLKHAKNAGITSPLVIRIGGDS